MGGRVHRQTRAPSERADGRTDWRTGRRTGGRVDGGGHARRTEGDGGGQWADGRTGRRVDELADCRTGEHANGGGRVDDGFPKVKLLI